MRGCNVTRVALRSELPRATRVLDAFHVVKLANGCVTMSVADRRVRLGPGPHPTGRFLAAPHSLGPHQRHRSPAEGDVADQVRPPGVRDRDNPAAGAAGHRLGGLHQQLQLAADLTGSEHHEAGQAEDPRGDVDGLGSSLTQGVARPALHAQKRRARKARIVARL